MVRAFVGQTNFSGRHKEDLDGMLETLETYAEMCDLNNYQKRKSIPNMLSCNSLSLFNKWDKESESFEEAVTLLITWYNYS